MADDECRINQGRFVLFLSFSCLLLEIVFVVLHWRLLIVFLAPTGALVTWYHWSTPQLLNQFSLSPRHSVATIATKLQMQWKSSNKHPMRQCFNWFHYSLDPLTHLFHTTATDQHQDQFWPILERRNKMLNKNRSFSVAIFEKIYQAKLYNVGDLHIRIIYWCKII